MGFSPRTAARLAHCLLAAALSLAAASAQADPVQNLKDDLARFKKNAQDDIARMQHNIKNLQDDAARWREEINQDLQNWSDELGRDVAVWQIVAQRAQGNYLLPTAGTMSGEDFVQWQGLARRYLYIRHNNAQPGAPVVIIMHPHGLTPEKMGNLVRAGRLAASFGAVVLLPEAVNGAWNEDPSASQTADDVGFISALIDKAVVLYGINPKRVYATGYSSGGFMAARLGCELSAKIAGVGEVAATMRGAMKQTCAPLHPMPATIIAGTSDTVVPYNGIFEALQSAPASAQMWAGLASCTGATTTTRINPNGLDNTTVDLLRYRPCAGTNEVRLYTVNGGGHTWPGSPYGAYTMGLGRTSQDIDATLELWNFLSPYSAP